MFKRASVVEPNRLLLDSYLHAVGAVQAEAVLPMRLPPCPSGDLIVVGAGKASAAMAASVERHWAGRRPPRGLVLTRHGHGVETKSIDIVEAGHPLPDAQGLMACAELLHLVRSAKPEDHVLALISGGGSSLLTLPEDGLDLADIRDITGQLLRSGVPIAEINGVRRHLSKTLGGRLAAYCSAPISVLIISDVVGDDPRVIASGPFHEDGSTPADALVLLERWKINVPPRIYKHLRKAIDLSATPINPAAIDTYILATGRTALRSASHRLAEAGVYPLLLGDLLQGEARTLGCAHGHLALDIAARRAPGDRPIALLSGGETTVTVRGHGRGGRNSEYLLGLAITIEGHANIHAIACDTDGIDGSEHNAGAYLSPEHWSLAKARGIDAHAHLDDNDAYGFFQQMDALVMTGPTRTNVNDYRAILIT